MTSLRTRTVFEIVGVDPSDGGSATVSVGEFELAALHFEIGEALKKINAAKPPLPQFKNAFTEDERDVLDHLIAGRKIDAIKCFRQMKGAGLKEAKDFVERVEASLRETMDATWLQIQNETLNNSR